MDELWAALDATEEYPRWWSWLREFDGGPLVPGTVARFTVRPPLPYSLRFVVTVSEVVERERVVARVGGDVSGDAILAVSATADGGSQARLCWQLVLDRPSLARIEPVARPLMEWGHDLVVNLGVHQFRRRALTR